MFCPAIRYFDLEIDLSNHLDFKDDFHEISENKKDKIVEIVPLFSYLSASLAVRANVNLGNSI